MGARKRECIPTYIARDGDPGPLTTASTGHPRSQELATADRYRLRRPRGTTSKLADRIPSLSPAGVAPHGRGSSGEAAAAPSVSTYEPCRGAVDESTLSNSTHRGCPSDAPLPPRRCSC